MEARDTRLTLLFREFFPYVYRRASFLLRNSADAEDAASEVFLRLARSLVRNADVIVSKGSILHITTQVCIDRWRSTRIRREEALETCRESVLLQRSEDVDAWILVREAMDRLRGDLRTIAIYHVIDGCPLNEIARLMNTSEGTIERRIRKIRKKLQAFL